MVTRLSEDVWWVDLQGVNAYVVDGEEVTLVDTGMPWHSNRLVQAITTAGDAIKSVERVLITHFDVDHVGGLGRLDGLDATVYVGVDDEPYLSGREKPSWRTQKGAFQRVADVARRAPDLPVETVEDGDSIGGFDAYHTPGHTPGHTAFVNEELSAAFVGDLVRESGGELEAPPWYLNDDQEQAEDSVVAFVERAPATDIVAMGHGTPFAERGSERLAACAERLA
jgi:glyoxylase-like metal-dependent hydrolase (beta-lactamase superfamily II)